MRPIFALAIAAAAGCGPNTDAPGPPVHLQRVALQDVQGLSGGHAIWIKDDGSAIVQVVVESRAGQVGLWEKRHEIQFTPEQFAEIERLVGAHRFMTLRIPEHSAIPDEISPEIQVVAKSGQRHSVRKTGRDKNPRFDPLYGYLLELAEQVRGKKATREGPFDRNWRPDGFDEPR